MRIIGDNINIKYLFNSILWEQVATDLGRKPRIAIAGIPGAGKSTLTNKLLGKNSINIIFTASKDSSSKSPSFFEHSHFEIIDSSGITESDFTETTYESNEGPFDITDNFSHKIIESADIVLYLMDGERPRYFYEGVHREYHMPYYYDQAMAKILKKHPATIMVVNKTDVFASQHEQFKEHLEAGIDELSCILNPCKKVRISAQKDLNLIKLVQAIEKTLPRSGKISFSSFWADYTFSLKRKKLCVGFIRKYAITAGIIGTLPMPVVSITGLFLLLIIMSLHVGMVFGHRFSKEEAISVILSLFASSAIILLAYIVLPFIKDIQMIGLFLAAMTTGAMAYFSFQYLGEAAMSDLRMSQKILPKEVNEFYDNHYEQGKAKYSYKASINIMCEKL